MDNVKSILMASMEERGCKWVEIISKLDTDISHSFDSLRANIEGEADSSSKKAIVFDQYKMKILIDNEEKKFRQFAGVYILKKFTFILEKYGIDRFREQMEAFLDQQKREADPELWERRMMMIGDQIGMNKADDAIIEKWYEIFEQITE